MPSQASRFRGRASRRHALDGLHPLAGCVMDSKRVVRGLNCTIMSDATILKPQQSRRCSAPCSVRSRGLKRAAGTPGGSVTPRQLNRAVSARGPELSHRGPAGSAKQAGREGPRHQPTASQPRVCSASVHAQRADRMAKARVTRCNPSQRTNHSRGDCSATREMGHCDLAVCISCQ